MNDERKRLRELYNNLKADNYDLPEYGTFESDMADDNLMRQLYDNIKADNYDVPDYETFRGDMGYGSYQQPAEQPQGLPVNPATFAPVAPAAPSSGAAAVRAPFANEEAQRQYERSRFQKDMDKQVKGMQQRAEGMGERMEKMRQAVAKGNSFNTGEQRYNPATGKVETVHYTPQGEETTSMSDLADARLQTYNPDAWVRKHNKVQVGELAKNIDEQLAQINSEATAEWRARDEKRSFWENAARSLADTPDKTGSVAEETARMYENHPELRDLTAAKRALENAQRIINEADHNAKEGKFESTFMAGLGRGFGQKFSDVSTWDMGITEMSDNSAILNALESWERGELTPSQQALLDAKVVELATTEYFGSELGRGYKAGQVSAESLPFMIEMIANPLSATGRGASKVLAKYALKRFGRTAMKKGLKKAAINTAGALGHIGGSILGAGGMAATTGAIDVAADATSRMTGTPTGTFDENGNMHFNGADYSNVVDADKAGWQAFGARTIENLSEMILPEGGIAVGKWLSKAAGSKIGSRLGLKAANDFINKVGATSLAKTVTDLERQAQWHGGIGEFMEEIYGGLANAAIVGDQVIRGKDGKIWNSTDDKALFNQDNLIDTGLGVGVMSIVFPFVKTMGYTGGQLRAHRYKNKIRRAMVAADDAGLSAFGGDQMAWGAYRNTLAFGNEEDVKNAIRTAMADDNLSKEQKKAVWDYAVKAQGYRSVVNMTDKMMAEGREERETEMAAAETYDNAYNDATSDEQRLDVNLMYADTREKVRQMVGDEMLQRLDDDPFVVKAELDNDATVSDDVRYAVADYIAAKSAVDGINDRINDEADMMAAQQREESRRRQFRGEGENEGALRPVTITMRDGKQREVYLTQGELALTESGLVDPEKTKELNNVGTLTAYDPAEGREVSFAPSDIVEVGQMTTAEQQEQNIETNKQAYIQQQQDAATGRFNPQPGQQIEVPDMGTATVLATDDETVTLQMPDGTQQSMAIADIQQIADGVAMEDYRQRHPEAEQPSEPATEAKGAPETFSEGMMLTVKGENGEEQQMEVIGRASYSAQPGSAGYREDPNGGYVALFVPGEEQPRYMLESKLREQTVDYREQEAEQPAAEVEQPTEDAAEQSTAGGAVPAGESAETAAAPAVAPDVEIYNNVKGEYPEAYRDKVENTVKIKAKRVADTKTALDKANAALTATEYGSKEEATAKQKRDKAQQAYDAAVADSEMWNAVKSLKDQELLSEREAKDAVEREERERRRAETEAARKREQEAYEAEMARRKAEQEEKDRRAEAALENMAKMRDEAAAVGADFPIEDDADAMEVMNDLEPHTLEEVAAWLLSDTKGKMKIDPEEMRRHTGYSSTDMNKFPFIFKKDGVSPEKFGEHIEQIARENGVSFDEADTNAGFNALLNVLGEVGGLGDLKNYIKDARRVQAERLHSQNVARAAAVQTEDDWIAQHGGMSREEYASYINWMEDAVEQGKTEITDEEFNQIFNTYDTRTATTDEESQRGGAAESGTDGAEARQAATAADDTRRGGEAAAEEAEQPAGEVAEQLGEDTETRYNHILEKARIWQEHLRATNEEDYADELDYIIPELNGQLQTDEDIATRYNNVLEKAKIWQEHLLEVGDKDYADELDYIIPELKDYALPGNSEIKTEGADTPLESLAEVKKFMETIGYKGSLSRVLTDDNGRKFVKYYASGNITPNIYLGETTPFDIWQQFNLYGNNMGVDIPADIKAELDRVNEDARGAREALWAEDREQVKDLLTEAGIPFYDVIDSERGSRIVFTDRKNDNGNYVDYMDVADVDQAREDIAFVREKAMRVIAQRAVTDIAEQLDEGRTAKNDELIQRIADMEADAEERLEDDTLSDDERARMQAQYDAASKWMDDNVRSQKGMPAAPTAEQKTLTKGLVGWLNGIGIKTHAAVRKGQEVLNKYRELVRSLRAYHGSGADFDAFDHSHMGEGEGAQAYGYGTYVTEVEGIGRTYAEDNSRNVAKYKGNENIPNDILDRIESAIAAGWTFNRIWGYWRDMAKSERERGDEKSAKEYESWAYWISRLSPSDFERKKNRILYTVEIPDDNGHNYLDWVITIPKSDRRRIADVVRRLDGEPAESVEYPKYTGGWQQLADMIERNQWAYQEVRDRLVQAFGGRIADEKRVSDLMHSAGFVGVKYPAEYRSGGRGDNAKNYVIFDEGDIKITDKIRFQRAADGEYEPKPVFYSNAMNAVEGIKQEKATAEQWLAMLQKNGGLKAGEDKWIGLSDWLNDHKGKSLTKQEVLDYIRENQIQVEEVEYSDAKMPGNFASNLRNELNEKADEICGDVTDEYADKIAKAEDFSDELDDIEDKMIQEARRRLDDEFGVPTEHYISIQFENDRNRLVYTPTRSDRDFSNNFAQQVWNQRNGNEGRPINETRLQYTTDFLDNKREIALVVPTIEPWNEGDEVHFGDAGEGRAVAWVRFGDTTIDNGNSVSHQIAKKRMDDYYNSLQEKYGKTDDPIGFATKLTPEESAEMSRLESIYDKTFGEGAKKVLVIDEIQSKRHQEGREKGYKDNSKDKAMSDYTAMLYEKYGPQFNVKLTDEEDAEYQRLQRERMQEEVSERVPDAPFDKNWHEVAFKRMLRYAAENGYDKVAWTTGEQQAERYDLSKSIKDMTATGWTDYSAVRGDDAKEAKLIAINTIDGGEYAQLLVDKSGKVLSDVDDQFVGKQLSDIVGKDLAKRLMEDGYQTIEGDGLRIGGEGMKGFYDQILPRFADKYGKKWNVKTTDINLPNIGDNGLTMHSVDVTPEMKASVLEGQPMFFRDKDGEVIGYTLNGEIYIDPRYAKPETPVHEYAHLIVHAIRANNPQVWGRWKKLAHGEQDVIDFVKAKYPEYSENEDDFWEEVIANYTGREGGKRLEDEMRKQMRETPDIVEKARIATIFHKLRDLLKRFWDMTKDIFSGSTKGIDNFKSMDDVVDLTLAALANKFDPRAAQKAAEEKTLMGVHNISEEKLKKALKKGGFANPSMAVIDTKNGGFDSYGDISLIPKASLIDSSTGRNAGTYGGDAWTPTYPGVEYYEGKETAEKLKALTAGLPESLGEYIRRRVSDYMDKNYSTSGLEYLFLKEHGIDMPIAHNKRRYPNISNKEIYERIGVSENIYGSDLYKEYEKMPQEQLFDFNLWLDKYGDEAEIAKVNDMIARLRGEGKDEAATFLIDRYSKPMTFANFDSHVHNVGSDEREAGSENLRATLENAAMEVDKQGLRNEFDAWLEKQIDNLGYEERLFAGFTPSGNRRYLPNTLENASRLMNKESDVNAYDNTSLNATRAALMYKMQSLDDIRKHRDLLQKGDGYDESYKEMSDKMFDVAHRLSDMQVISDNPFSNVDYAILRMQDAFTKKDPIGYLNKEYGYSIDKDSEFAKDMLTFMDEVKDMPVKYFETKFKRPVMLDEFAVAVVPEGTSQEVVQALQNAGLDVRTYDGTPENRQAVTLEAVRGRDDIRFQFAGERGAAAADRSEEVTHRIDNLGVAREMENEGKDAKAIKMATGWERGADGKWRYEISDFDRFDPTGNVEWMQRHPDAQRYKDLLKKSNAAAFGIGEPMSEAEQKEFEKLKSEYKNHDFNATQKNPDNLTLQDFVESNELFKAYPMLKSIPVKIIDDKNTNLAGETITRNNQSSEYKTAKENLNKYPTYNDYAKHIEDEVASMFKDVDRGLMSRDNAERRANNLRANSHNAYEDWQNILSSGLSKNYTITINKAYDKEFANSLVHEVQHVIQDIEGFAQGGSANTVKAKIEELVDEKRDNAEWIKTQMRRWADARFNASKMELVKTLLANPREWAQQKAVEYYWDVMNTLDNTEDYWQLNNYQDDFGEDYNTDEIAKSGYHIDEAIEAFNNIAEKERGKLTDRDFATVDEFDKLNQALKQDEKEMYNRLAGEVEARNAARRKDMTAEERRNSLAADTEDVAREDQIFLYGNGDSNDIRFRSLDPESDNVVDNAEVGTRPLSDREKVAKLEAEPKVKVYRSMQLIDGKLYPPMSAKSEGQLREPSEIGVWEEADERPDLADDNGKFTLNKGNGKSLKAAYNPYIHTSRTMLNDQFSEAQSRPNLVVVEMEVPESELTSDYKAEKAKDSVGAKQWKAGVIQGQLSGTREVILSRWAKPVRIVPDSEVAANIAEQIDGQVAVMPSNVVTPSVRAELEKLGVQFVETDNTGKLVDGPNKGKTWASVYGKKANNALMREGDNLPFINKTYEEGLAEARAAGYTKKQFDAMIERNERNARKRFADWAEKLNLTDKITFVDTIDEVEGLTDKQREQRRDKKGWYNPRTDKIVIILDNHHSQDDVLQTILHEGVAHHGLRAMFGKAFDDFLDNVYAGAEYHIRLQIAKLAKNHGWNIRTATEEYLATLAENTEFESLERSPFAEWWSKIKQFFLDMLHKLGIKGAFTEGDNIFSDNELRYILWRSYQNLVNPGRYRSFVDTANDVVMQDKLKVGNYEETSGERGAWYAPAKAAEPGIDLDEVATIEAEPEMDGFVSGLGIRMTMTDGNTYKLWVQSGEDDGMQGVTEFYGDNEDGIPDEEATARFGKLFGEDVNTIFGSRIGNLLMSPRTQRNGITLSRDEIKQYAKAAEPTDNSKTLRDLKRENPDLLLLEDKDDHYEARGEDAKRMADILGVKPSNKGVVTISSDDIDNAMLRMIGGGLRVATYRNMKASEDDVRFREGDGAMFREGDGAEDILNDRSIGLRERMTAAAARLAESNAGDVNAKNALYRAIGGNLADLRKAMGIQKEFDKSTVKRVADLAKILIRGGYLDNMSKNEVSRLLSAVNNATGKADISDSIRKVMDIMVESQLRNAENALKAMEKVKASKVDAKGVEVQGVLDVAGQQTLKTFKETRGWSEDELTEAMANAQDKFDDKNNAVVEEAVNEYIGLQAALWYVQNIHASKVEERELKQELDDARNATDRSREYEDTLLEAIQQNKVERIQAYNELSTRLGNFFRQSIENAREFKEADKERVREIQHNANSDMEGRPSKEHYKPKFMDKFVNNSLVQFLFSPLSTFDQMLRLFGSKSANGEGYLYNRFMRGWVDAREKEIRGVREKYAMLDAKVKSLFGREAKSMGELIRKIGSMPKMNVEFWDGGEMKEHTLTQGNLMYIYMVNQMLDGRMKLRKMGIDEKMVDTITRNLDPRLIELADWMQNEFLVETRNEYNETHKRMFGAPMAAIENYFPLKILANARVDKPEDLDNFELNDGISTKTGSIIKRRRNALALDIMGANALNVILDHVAQMEHWNAFAEYNRDLNTLRTYKRFRNQVKNMNTIYGSGDKLWQKFNDVAQMATGSYRPKRANLDAAAVNFAKGVTAAKVSFRIYTALKQFLSMPAYIPDARPDLWLKNLATPWKSWNWAMENLPIFEERWKSRMAGDPRLLKSELDWKGWRNNVVQMASKIGMSPNAFVDALTVSIGAKTIYESRKARYLKEGYSEEQADRRAKQDAEVAYNETQQSSEGAFLSPMQVDRSWLSVAFTVFRNSSMAYQRQLHDALRNLKRDMKKGNKAESVKFMAKQMEREGVDADKAQEAAEKRYNRQIGKDILRVATFGYILQLCWNLGAKLPYLLFGDDDDKKKEMMDDVWAQSMFGWGEGLTGGDVFSQAGKMAVQGKGNPEYLTKEMPITSDIKDVLQEVGNGKYGEVVNDMVNLAVQIGIGMNPQSITDAVLAVMDACGDDPALAHETMIAVMRILQVPQSQIKEMYFDEVGLSGSEVSNYTPEQLARRYAEYKVKRGYFVTPWNWNDKGLIAKEQEKADKAIKERMGKTADTEVDEEYSKYQEQYKEFDQQLKEYRGTSEYKNATPMEKAELLSDYRQDNAEGYAQYDIFKSMDATLTKWSKYYLKANTDKQAQVCKKAIEDYKKQMVAVMDATNDEQREAERKKLAGIIEGFYKEYGNLMSTRTQEEKLEREMDRALNKIDDAVDDANEVLNQ